MSAADTALAPARAHDPQDMMGAILSLPEQCERARQIALDADLGAVAGREFNNIVVAGLGGSAIGGDFLRALYAPYLKCPVEVVRDYHLPAYVGEQTLFFAASNSGNTEETLSAYAAARASRAAIVAFTTGGELLKRARQDGVPAIVVPGGLQPRAALGFSFVPLIVAAAKLGAMPTVLLDDLDEAAAALRGVRDRCSPDAPDRDNEARKLAAGWVGRIPVIYGSQGERGVVAYRWKTQINENAKAYAIANVFPELNHNETVGWSGSMGQGNPESNLAVTILRDDREPPHIQMRVRLTEEIIAKHAARIDEVWARGQSALARMLSLSYTGDFASCYLAYAYGEDPTPVRVIDWLKSELAKA
jgi:glucose/mannose-6-phosphate isomerase